MITSLRSSLAILSAIVLTVEAAPGDLDVSFGNGGKVTTAIGLGSDTASGMAIQSDGKLLVVGSSAVGSSANFALVRYNVDGSLDTSFNSTGKVTTPFPDGASGAHSVAVQGDGKIVVAGYARVREPVTIPIPLTSPWFATMRMAVWIRPSMARVR
jgi:uncharacterized delta-60 repeat protein